MIRETECFPDSQSSGDQALGDPRQRYLLAHYLPNAQLRIYPDSGHGFLDQYRTLFADLVKAFSTAVNFSYGARATGLPVAPD